MHDCLQGVRPYRGWPAVVDSQRSVARYWRAARPQDIVWKFSVVGDLAKSKERQAEGTASTFNLLLIVFDKVGKPTEQNRPEGPGQLAGQLSRERYVIMGT